jgi:hypothetical protein
MMANLLRSAAAIKATSRKTWEGGAFSAVSSCLAISPLSSRAASFLWHFPPVARSRC